jgi:hypothetical protein
MALLMVRPTWPAPTFVRTLVKRDRKGKPLESKRVTFSKDSPVELTDEELQLLGSDLGNAVFEVTLAEKSECDTWNHGHRKRLRRRRRSS